jgi:hypothetical protein
MLGVVVNDRLSAVDHITKTISVCSKALYALRVLRTHGMPEQALQRVFQATVLPKLLYCSPAWSGFCRATDMDRFDSFIRRSKRSCYCADSVPDVRTLIKDAEDSLFKRILANPQHTLHQFLPPLKNYTYNFRQRPHNHQLPDKSNSLVSSNFFNRKLYHN